LLEKLGLSCDVILIPGESGDRLREIYQHAKIFVFPSLIENSPNILLEAMMAGLPIAASSFAPMPEFCTSAAEYFNALDVPDISRKIEVLLEDPGRLADLSTRARAQVSKYTWDDFVRNVMRHVEMVVNQSEYRR
jgi:glycosyltransferase involved in cell wall biosynthesis